MKIGRVKNLNPPAHHWVERARAVVARFGEHGVFPKECLSDIATAAGEKLVLRIGKREPIKTQHHESVLFSCCRIAHVYVREDGQIFEEYTDHLTTEDSKLTNAKLRIIGERMAESLSVERCVGCKKAFQAASFVVKFRGNYACLNWKCLKVLSTSRPHPRYHAKSGSFTVGGTFDIAWRDRLAPTRIEEIATSCVEQEVDSSLGDPNIRSATSVDAIRQIHMRIAEQAKSSQKAGKKKT